MADKTFRLQISGTGNGNDVTYGSFTVQKPQNYTNNSAFIGQHPLTEPEASMSPENIGEWTSNNAGKLMSCFEINWGGAREGWKDDGDWDSRYKFPDEITTSADLLRYIFMLRWKLEHMQPVETFTITWNKNNATTWSTSGATTSFTESKPFSSLTKPTAVRTYTYDFGSAGNRVYTYTHNDATDWGVAANGNAFSGNLLLQNYTFYALWTGGSWNDSTLPNPGNDVQRTITWNKGNGTGGSGGSTQYTAGYHWVDRDNQSSIISSLPNNPSKGITCNSKLYVKTTSGLTIESDPTLTGQTFKGWYTAASGGTKITSSNIYQYLNADADVTFYAQYKTDISYKWYVGHVTNDQFENPSSLNTIVTNNGTSSSSASGPSTLTIPTTTGEVLVYIYPTVWGTPTLVDSTGFETGDDNYLNTGFTPPSGYGIKYWDGDSSVRGKTLNITWSK